MICAKCIGGLPQMPDSGIVYIAAASAAIEATIKHGLAALGLPYSLPHTGILAFMPNPEQFAALGKYLYAHLTARALQECKYYMLAGNRQMEFRDLQKAEPLENLVLRTQGDRLLEMLAGRRYFPEYQPIVFSGSPETVYAYEGLFRGREPNGDTIYPQEIFDVARKTNMLHYVDIRARQAIVSGAAEYGIGTNVFVNFFPSEIDNPEYSADYILQEIQQAGADKNRIVFEVVESEGIRDIKALVNLLREYRNAGLRVALDDLGSAYSSLSLLSVLRPDFIKIDMELIRNIHEDDYKGHIVNPLLNVAQRLGIHSIVEGVETMEEWEWLKNNGADFMQGYLFAKAAAPPPAITFRPVKPEPEGQPIRTG